MPRSVCRSRTGTRTIYVLSRATIFVAALAVPTTVAATLARAQTAPATPEAVPSVTGAEIVASDVDVLAGRLAESVSPSDLTLIVRQFASLRGGQATRAAELVANLPEARRRVVLNQLADALSRVDAPAAAWVPLLGQQLRAANADQIRQHAASALASIGTPQAIAVLVDASAAGNAVPIQRTAAEALGRIPDVAAVQALATMLGDAHLLEARLAAGASLAELTGAPVAAVDVEGWRRWTADALAGDLVVLQALLSEQAVDRSAILQNRLIAAEAAVERLVRTRYGDAAQDKRRQMLTVYLGDRDVAVRLAAARLVLENVGLGELPGDRSVALVRAAVADADPRVRQLAARIIRDVGDRDGARLALERLPRESDPQTRLVVLEAVARLVDASAVGLFLDVARDDAVPQIRQAAAEEAARVAVAANSPATVTAVSNTLRNLAADAPSDGDRIALLAALSQLPDPTLGRFWTTRLAELGTQGPSVPVGTALDGLASVADAQTADVASSFLEHPDATVRAAAVRAVAATAGLPRFPSLQALFDPRPGAEPPAPPVLEAAREAFVELLPTADDVELAKWPDRLRDPQLKLVVLEELISRARKADAPKLLGYRLHEAADLLSGPLDEPARAASLFGEALSLELQIQERSVAPAAVRDLPPTPLTVARLEGTIVNFLLAGNLASTSEVAVELLGRRPKLSSDIGASVRRAADKLSTLKRLPEARAAAEAALAWQPPLDDVSRRNLTDLLRRLQ